MQDSTTNVCPIPPAHTSKTIFSFVDFETDTSHTTHDSDTSDKSHTTVWHRENFAGSSTGTTGDYSVLPTNFVEEKKR